MQKTEATNELLASKSVLHILAQEKCCYWRTGLLHATAVWGYHAFNKKPGYYVVQLRVNHAFYIMLLLLGFTMYSTYKW